MAKQKNSESFPFLVTVGVVATVIGTVIATFFVSDGFRAFIDLMFHGCGAALVWFLTASYTVPLWLIALLFLGTLCFVISAVSAHNEKRRLESEEYKTSPARYVKDIFDGIVWTWRYYGDRPIDLYPICKDGMPMVYTTGIIEQPNFRKAEMIWLACESCGRKTSREFGADSQVIEDKVARQILKKIHTKEYLQVINAGSSAIHE